MDDEKLTQSELAKRLLVTRRTVIRWGKEGLPRNKDGTYSWKKSFTWFVNRLEARFDLKSSRPEPEGKFTELFREERWKMVRLERLEREGKVVQWATIDSEWLSRVVSVTVGLGNFADRISALVAGRTRAEIYPIVEAEVRLLRESYCREGRYTPRVIDEAAFAADLAELIAKYKKGGGDGPGSAA